MDISRIKSLLQSGREVFSYLFLGLCAAYAYATYIFRPQNPFSYPGVEDKLYIVLLMAAVAAAVLYLPLVLRAISKKISSIRYHRTHMKIAGLVLHASAALPGIGPAFRRLRGAAVSAEAYVRTNFYPGGRWFFATLGLELFLVILPLVLTNQKSLVEVSALFFLAYAVFSYVNKIDDRVMIVTALFFLASCPFLLVLKEDAKAELSAIYAYYALCTGVLLQLADYVKNRDKYGPE